MTKTSKTTSDFEALRVGDLMTIDPVVVRSDDTLETAERLLAAYRITGLPVVDPDGHLLGVVSRTDLVPAGGTMRTLLRENARHLRVGELMTAPAVTVPMTATLVEAARLMREHRIHRLVTVDDAGRPIGVLSASDFVNLVADG